MTLKPRGRDGRAEDDMLVAGWCWLVGVVWCCLVGAGWLVVWCCLVLFGWCWLVGCFVPLLIINKVFQFYYEHLLNML